MNKKTKKTTFKEYYEDITKTSIKNLFLRTAHNIIISKKSEKNKLKAFYGCFFEFNRLITEVENECKKPIKKRH